MGPNKVTNHMRRDMRLLRSNGATLSEIAERFDVSVPCVLYHTRDIFVPDKRGKKRKFDHAKAAELRRRYNVPVNVIAERFGVSRGSIWRAVRACSSP